MRLHDRSGSSRAHTIATAPPVLENIEHELEALADRAEAELVGAAILPGVGPVSAAHSPKGDPRDPLRREREATRQVMEHDIIRLHRQLETGIGPGRMAQLAGALTAHAPAPAGAPWTRFQDRVEGEVLRSLYARAGEAAWARLQDRLAQTGLAWPALDGLAKTPAPEDLQRQRGAHTERVRADFLLTPPGQAAALIHGTVDAWRYGYPARNSYLWLQTALCGVAAALRSEVFATSVELWLWRSSDLDQELLKRVSEKLKDARSILEGEMHNTTDAAEVVERVNEVCATVIPQVVWNHAAKRLRWNSPHVLALQESSGREAGSRTDPVCGMTLPERGAAERLDSEGHVFYFCCVSCRLQFEERSQWKQEKTGKERV